MTSGDMTTPDAPVADWIDPLAMFGDPYPTYERLRCEAPVAWVPALDMYVAATYDACMQIEADPELYSARGTEQSFAGAIGGSPMLAKDDPEHLEERRVINPVLRPNFLDGTWRSVFEANARVYAEAMEDVGAADADLNRDYAAPLAARNLADLLSMKDIPSADMHRWSETFIAAIGNIMQDPAIYSRATTSQQEVSAVLDELLPFLRRHPDDSLTSALANSGLSDERVRLNVMLTISGGMNEPQHAITSAVWALSRHPDQRARAIADPSAWPTVFNETMRWLSPIGMIPRLITRDTAVAGVRVTGQRAIMIGLGSANRDEAVFHDGERFDLDRPKRTHLAFGKGAHMCAGHWVARVSIGEIAIPHLFERFPDLNLARDGREPEWFGFTFRGLVACPVTW